MYKNQPGYSQMPQKQQFNPMQLMGQFQNFCNNFQGDPQQVVQQMLDTGQMTQDQYAMVSNMTRQYQGMFQQFMNMFGPRR